MLNKIFIFFISSTFLASSAFALEDLTELELRKARKSTNTFYSGEDSSNHYIWQPQTVIYTDTSTGHEVIVWTQTDTEAIRQAEYGWQPWSADGKRFAFAADQPVGSFTRGTGPGSDPSYPFFVSRADQSNMRPVAEIPWRVEYNTVYFNWSPTEPDVAYNLGRNESGVTGLDENAIYKATLTDTSGSYVLWVDLYPSNTNYWTNGMKGAITGDGKYMVVASSPTGELSESPFYFADLESQTVEISWTITNLSLDGTWGETLPTGDGIHDEFLRGNSTEGYWFEFYWTSPNRRHWRARITGSDGGIPTHTPDKTSPYTWWDGLDSEMEVQVFNSGEPTDPFSAIEYWSHHGVDQWGTHVAYSNGDQDCNGWGAGLTVSDLSGSGTAVEPANSGEWCEGGAQYVAWNGWSDYIVGSVGAVDDSATDASFFDPNNAGRLKYNSTSDHKVIANLHSTEMGEFSKPGQSPDGTKMVMLSNWLNPNTGLDGGDIYIPVVEHPHPPEVISVTAGVVRFDWRTDQVTSRGYTQRGWPDESIDDPPPPRETEKFRLWKQESCTGDWNPVATVNANIFSMYDFSDGTWAGSKYWEMTDSNYSGSDCYSVSAVEWSGLESRVKSNIFSDVTDDETVAYPADPGASTGITSTYNAELLRYYNIYAADIITPTAIQQDRIASIPASSETSYVDWLGETTGDTNYIVTAVDTQGEESDPLTSVLSAHQQSPATAEGQYTITWDSENPAATGSLSDGTGSLGDGTGSFQ